MDYLDLLKIRRKYNSELLYEQIDRAGSSYYELKTNAGGIVVSSVIKQGTSDYTDFEANIKPYANYPVNILPETISTHDYSDDSSWSATDNSLYSIQAETGKVLSLLKTTIICDKDMVFSGEKIVLTIWKGITSACPAPGSEATTFNDSPFVPGVGGWAPIQKPWSTNQEVHTYAYLSPVGTPLYSCIAFEYNSIEDLLSKSQFQIVSDHLISDFHFIEPVVFRSSLNERIECYLSNHNPVASPNGVPSRAVFKFGYTDEF